MHYAEAVARDLHHATTDARAETAAVVGDEPTPPLNVGDGSQRD